MKPFVSLFAIKIEMDNKQFRKWNHVTAAIVFLISAFTYLSTIEPTASYWECGEFIA